jgi:transcription initiation factor TFIID subunit 1, fungi type
MFFLTFIQEESEAISTLTGFSLDQVLTNLQLPSGSGLNSRLGLSTNLPLNARQIFQETWSGEGGLGSGQGQDWEDEVDRELKEEGLSDEDITGEETQSLEGVRHKEKKVRIIKRLVERPKTVYERFPAFEKDKVLDFTELFKGYTVKKSRLSKKPFHGVSSIPYSYS